MQIDSLKYFFEVAKLKSISKVANNSHISQPALSHQLLKIEQQLGVKLLERSNRGVELTKDGEILYKYARQILIAHKNLIEELSLRGDKKKDLNIATSGVTGNFLISNITMDVVKIFKNFNLNISNNLSLEQQVLLLNNSADIIIGTEMIYDIDLVSNYIGTDRLILVSKKNIDKEKVEKLNIALLDEGGSIQLNNIKNISLKTNSLRTIKNYLENNDTAAIVPKIIVEEELKNGEFIDLKYSDYKFKYDLFISYKKDIDAVIKRKISLLTNELEKILCKEEFLKGD